MDKAKLYHDIAERTRGDIYIGVVGPVRTGKSTFIKRFMDLIVLPNMTDEHAKVRVVDELPQSGAGKSIMTTQPKFVPNDAVELELGEDKTCRIRLIDCVGYLVPGAIGHEENAGPRLVRTPWFEQDIPFAEAAAIGTQKVITDHATIGIVMTTDGTITDLPREAYLEAEAQVLEQVITTEKPFVLVINSRNPDGTDAQELRAQLEAQYGIPAVCLNVLEMTQTQAESLIENILLAFPLRMIQVKIPAFLRALPPEHDLVQRLMLPVYSLLPQLRCVRDYGQLMDGLKNIERFAPARLEAVSLATGQVTLSIQPEEGLFYEVLGEVCGCHIADDFELFSAMKEFLSAKKEYDRVAGALLEARHTGYGLVQPSVDEMELLEPEIIQQGSHFGVRLRARASGLHVIRVDVDTEVSPIVGTQEQSAALVEHLMGTFEKDPGAIWQTNIFGKPLYDLVREGMQGKIGTLPEAVRERLQMTLERIVNEGCNGLICIML
ncbi:MAG: stage IV sporulation protein A [Clostridia bacterium]|nr:stage IV sporulation protein A [Clostridia bacterium]